MAEQPRWWDTLKKVPAWISGMISFVTAVIGFVLLIQGNIHLGVTVLVALVIVFILGSCLYLIFARTEPLVAGGRGVYRFEKYRLWALVALGLMVVLIALVLLYKPFRDQVKNYVFESDISAATTIVPTCTPSPYAELPPESIAVIEPLKSAGLVSRAPYTSLRLQHQSGLWLASGIMVEFKEMQRFELFNPGFNTDFAADVVITFLDCTTLEDRIQSESGSFLTANTENGPLELHILEVRRVDFQW